MAAECYFLPKWQDAEAWHAICERKCKGKDVIMPEISRFYGIIIGMYNADHNPPHFHVRYNDYRATIDIQTGEVEGRLPRRVLNMVYEWLDLHKEELIANWQRMEKGEMMVEIKPLD